MANFNLAHNNYLNYCASDGTGWWNADFNKAQELVKRAEGGYSNDPRDKGNWVDGILVGTNWGISAPVLKVYLGHILTMEETKKLSYSTALEIYKKGYWNAIKGDQINDQKLAEMLYDTSVNQGSGKAIKYVKDSLDIKTYDVNEINKANPKKLFNQIGAKREADYKKLGGYALNSWLDRLKKLGYGDVLDVVQKNQGKTMIVLLGIGLLVTGIYLYK